MLDGMGEFFLNPFQMFLITFSHLSQHLRFCPRIFDGKFIEQCTREFDRCFEFSHLKITEKMVFSL